MICVHSAERNWTADEVVLHALGLADESLVLRERRDIARLRGTWDSDEAAMFDTALTAFEHLEGAPLFEARGNATPVNPAAGGRRGLERQLCA